MSSPFLPKKTAAAVATSLQPCKLHCHAVLTPSLSFARHNGPPTVKALPLRAESKPSLSFRRCNIPPAAAALLPRVELKSSFSAGGHNVTPTAQSLLLDTVPFHTVMPTRAWSATWQAPLLTAGGNSNRISPKALQCVTSRGGWCYRADRPSASTRWVLATSAPGGRRPSEYRARVPVASTELARGTRKGRFSFASAAGESPSSVRGGKWPQPRLH